MLYKVRLSVEAYHYASATWHTYRGHWHVRAVSRRHAINKGLHIAQGLPCYSDRADNPDWAVDAEATIVEDTGTR